MAIRLDKEAVTGINCEGRRHIVLRRRENEAARRCNSSCEQTTLSKVKEFFPLGPVLLDIARFVRGVFGIVPRRAP